jgi:hypothetical protein
MNTTELFDSTAIEAARSRPWEDRQWDAVRDLLARGTSRGAIAALLTLAGAERKQVAYFQGPILVHPPGDADIPERLRRAISLDRFDAVHEECVTGTIGEFAVPSDLAAVLMTASLAAPLSSDYADMFVWATAVTGSKHGWENIPTDLIVPDPRSEPIRSAMDVLGRDIRRRIVAAAPRRTIRRRRGSAARTTELYPASLF